jgi:DMSO/TMAO reductase YedYZ molybdopterin-dependent catalytic subunit
VSSHRAEISRASALLNGFLAAGTALLALILGRLATARPGFLEAVSDGVLRYVPLDVFEAGLSALGPLAKGMLYGAVAAGMLAAGALLALAARHRSTPRRAVFEALLLAIGVFLLAEAVVLPLAGLGPFGFVGAADPLSLHVPVAVAAIAYGGVLVALRETFSQPRAADDADLGRRALLGRAVALLAAGAVSGAVLAVAAQIASAARKTAVATQTFADRFGPTPALTPVNDFYRVDKNLLPPTVDGRAWRLRIDGLVDRPLELTIDDLRALPSREAYRTLECISFEIVRGDTLIGNQRWRGVPASELLDRAGAQAAGSWVLWEAEDGYTESIPIAVARDAETWVVYEMGGAPLTSEHGFPARVLIAGRFGMKQPKWLRRMRVADHDESGYWEQRGWDRDAFVRTMSRIDYPRIGDTVRAGEPFTAYGIANSGDRRIERVEVSADGGGTWIAAELEDASRAPLGPLTWVRWRATLTVAAAGPARLVVRARDGKGDLQEGRETTPLPSGATGWHAIRILVG